MMVSKSLISAYFQIVTIICHRFSLIMILQTDVTDRGTASHLQIQSGFYNVNTVSAGHLFFILFTLFGVGINHLSASISISNHIFRISIHWRIRFQISSILPWHRFVVGNDSMFDANGATYAFE